jgi:hypothetical protein
MADSENSRTLPSVARGKTVSNSGTLASRKSINGRNLFAVARNLLASRTAELREQRADRPPGPTPAAELWQSWLALHQKRERMTRFQQKNRRPSARGRWRLSSGDGCDSRPGTAHRRQLLHRNRAPQAAVECRAANRGEIGASSPPHAMEGGG